MPDQCIDVGNVAKVVLPTSPAATLSESQLLLLLVSWRFFYSLSSR